MKNYQGEASQREYLASIDAQEGKLGQAQGEYEKAIELYDTFDDRSSKAMAIGNLGSILAKLGDLDGAAGHLETAIGIFEDIQDKKQEAAHRCTLSWVYLQKLEIRKAQSSLAECLELARTVESALEYFDQQGMLDDEALAEVMLARVYLAQGEPRKAWTFIDEVKGRASEALKLRVQVALVEARTNAALGNLSEARRLIDSELPRTRQQPRLRVETLLAQRELEMTHGDRNKGRELLSLVEEEARRHRYGLVEKKAARLRSGS